VKPLLLLLVVVGTAAAVGDISQSLCFTREETAPVPTDKFQFGKE